MPENHVFISYARADGKKFAGDLHDQLEIDKFPAWLDIRDIQPGKMWDLELDQGLRDCWVLVFVMTPGSIASEVCQDEWSRVLSFKKPVLPLKLGDFPDTDIPLRLARRQYIDFNGDFDQAMARLRQRLEYLRSPQGQIEELENQQADLRRALERADESQSARLTKQIDELAEQIAYKKRALAEPEAVKAENQRAIQVGIDSERERLAKQREQDKAMTRRRVVGSAPQGVSENFKDRDKPFAEIVNTLLGEGFRAVSIYGKGGVGKTALACKVMHDLEKDYSRVHGLVYLSTRVGLGISFEQIYASSAKMLGGETETTLNDTWKTLQNDLNGRIQTLLEAYGDHRCILLLDNLEDLLDKDGQITDAELKAFVDAFLRQRHGAKLLLTSREPLNPANDARVYEKIVPLDEGLPESDAVELLKALDTDGDMGLLYADENLLKTIAQRTHGFPRALEAVAGILDRDPLLKPADLLANEYLWRSEVTEALVREAQSRLDEDARRVMQALAVYGRPVQEAAVRFLLEPYAGTLDVGTVLRRLARGKYVTVKRNTGELILHPLDKEFNYGEIPSGNEQDFHREALERRAGNYYVQIRLPADKWKTIADLEPQLAEFDHRLKAGDYDTAARLMDGIDFDYLMLWGYSKQVLPMREMLIGKIADKELEAGNLNVMGLACWNLGQTKHAITLYEKVLAICRETQNKRNEGAVLVNLGIAYRNLGEVQQAIHYYKQALVINSEIGNRRAEGINLSNLGLAYSVLGIMQQAIHYYKQALAIAREIDNKQNEGVVLDNLGLVYTALGDIQRAKDCTTQALILNQKTGNKRIEGYDFASLSRIHLVAGEYSKARQHSEAAVAIADEIGMARQQQGWRITLAETDLHLSHFEKALETITAALAYERPDSSHAKTVQGVVLLLLGRLDKARSSFESGIIDAEILLDKTAELYELKYMKAWALVGLAVCGDSARIPQAVQAYKAARANCDAAGVLAEARRRLDLLAPADTNGILAEIRQVLA